MGQPISATAVHRDGTEEQIQEAETARIPADQRVLEYADDSSTQLIPPQSDAFSLRRYRDLPRLPDGPVQYPLQIGGSPLHPVPGLRKIVGTTIG